MADKTPKLPEGATNLHKNLAAGMSLKAATAKAQEKCAPEACPKR